MFHLQGTERTSFPASFSTHSWLLLVSEPGSAWLQAVGQGAPERFVDIHMDTQRPREATVTSSIALTTGTLSAEPAAISFHIRTTAASQEWGNTMFATTQASSLYPPFLARFQTSALDAPNVEAQHNLGLVNTVYVVT